MVDDFLACLVLLILFLIGIVIGGVVGTATTVTTDMSHSQKQHIVCSNYLHDYWDGKVCLKNGAVVNLSGVK